MNKRIQVLIKQAGLDDADFPIENWDNVPLAKFAELIVRECIDTAFHKGHPDLEFLLKHFGVEE